MSTESPSSGAPIEEIFRRAVRAAKAGERAAARALFAEVTRTQPAIGQAWQWRAYLAQSPRERVGFLRKARELDPANGRIISSLRRALLEAGIAGARAGELADARRLFLEVTELDPKSELAWLWLTSLAERREEKLIFAERVLAINPENEQILTWKAKVLGPRPAGGALHASAGRVIMVVDDSPTVCTLVRRTLERRGYAVLAAGSPLEALSRLEEATPELIFLDVQLPDMDGFELCRHIRARPATREVPIVMLSGKDRLVDKVHGRMVGARKYITKPFKPEDLIATVEELAGGKAGMP